MCSFQLLKKHTCPVTTFVETFVSSYNFCRNSRVLLQLLKKHSCPVTTFVETFLSSYNFGRDIRVPSNFCRSIRVPSNFWRSIRVLLQLLKRHSCPLATFEATFVSSYKFCRNIRVFLQLFLETFVSSHNFFANIRVLLQLLKKHSCPLTTFGETLVSS